MNKFMRTTPVLLALLCQAATAAHWEIGSAESKRGEQVAIPVYLTGDGMTSDGQIVILFDSPACCRSSMSLWMDSNE